MGIICILYIYADIEICVYLYMYIYGTLPYICMLRKYKERFIGYMEVLY